MIVLFGAFVSTVLLSLTGLLFDVGYVYNQQVVVRTATDAAALAGAAESQEDAAIAAAEEYGVRGYNKPSGEVVYLDYSYTPSEFCVQTVVDVPLILALHAKSWSVSATACAERTPTGINLTR